MRRKRKVLKKQICLCGRDEGEFVVMRLVSYIHPPASARIHPLDRPKIQRVKEKVVCVLCFFRSWSSIAEED